MIASNRTMRSVEGVELVDRDTLLSTADIVSLHTALTPETSGMIGRRELALMQDGAMLINTARGALVDEAALVAEIKSGRLRAGLDVYSEEPLPLASELANSGLRVATACWQCNRAYPTRHVRACARQLICGLQAAIYPPDLAPPELRPATKRRISSTR